MAVDPADESINRENPQFWNQYSYARNNPIAFVDPDGEADIYVFRPTANSTSSAWAAIQAQAPKFGNTVTIYNGSSATTQQYAQAASATGATVVFSGHTVSDPSSGTVGSVLLSDGPVGTVPTATGTALLATPAVQASTVGLFGCDSTDLAPQYSPASVTSVEGGADGLTTLSALDAAAAHFTDAISRNQSPDQAASQAGGAIKRSKYKHDQDGDKVVNQPAPKK